MRSAPGSEAVTIANDARRALLDAGGRAMGAILEEVRGRRAARGAPFVSVLHLDDLGNIDWAQAHAHRPVTPGRLACAGEVLVSLLNPAIMRATVVPNDWAVVRCSAEFGIFTSAIDPYAALALLHHPLVRAQLAPLGRGATRSRRRITATVVLEAIAPPIDANLLAQSAARVAEGIRAVAAARHVLAQTYGLPTGPTSGAWGETALQPQLWAPDGSLSAGS